MHNGLCEKKPIKENLSVIIEEISGAFRSICRFCKRKFALDRIEKHESACENISKKRPLFDMLKKRIPFLEEIKEKIHSKRNSIKLIYPNSKWQKQHLELLKNLRQGEEESNYDDYVMCPYCSRRFAPVSAEKHIEICKNNLNKPRPPPSITSQRFPTIKKIDQPLTIRVNSLKSLYRPSSVYNNSAYIDRQNNISVEEPINSTVDIALSPIKIPLAKLEYAMQDLNESLISCPKCLKIIYKGFETHSKECKVLRPSATVKHLSRGNSRPILTNSRRLIETNKNRSNSTHRGSLLPACKKCHADFPANAKFCMMCGTLKPVDIPSIV